MRCGGWWVAGVGGRRTGRASVDRVYIVSVISFPRLTDDGQAG